MIATLDMIEDSLQCIVLPREYWWLRDESIVHIAIDGQIERIRWIAHLAETRQGDPIVATIDVRLGGVASEDEIGQRLEERVAQAIRDIEEFRRKVDAKADDAGGA